MEHLGGTPGASSVPPGKESAWTSLNLGTAVGQGQSVAVLEVLPCSSVGFGLVAPNT